MAFVFHSRCQSIEAVLRAQIDDLREELIRLHDQIEQERSRASDTEKTLIDRIIVMTNPMAARALAASTPAVSMPVVARGGGPVRSVMAMPGQRPRPRPEGKPGPSLVPPEKPIDYPALLEARRRRSEIGVTASASVPQAVDPSLLIDTDSDSVPDPDTEP